ncbi:SDR family NAD(P)-dependent oxidoreductase [Nocardia sp. 2]|uniref:SDR family NAD(P)-dependent oxidoreductase n=1 Tax=Nocardia acididurans TaxID=2802282 RepID=A0ABS1M0F0_9NOCA|nr:SDR family NAD(P)-dependent oxidoreductase [Nocardia acididurans]
MSKIALVTGGNQGLGLALVRGLGRALPTGSTVYLAARDPGRGAAAARLEAEGLRPTLEILDVTSDDSVRDLTARIAARHGGIDLVISNAGSTICPRRSAPTPPPRTCSGSPPCPPAPPPHRANWCSTGR